MEEMKPVKIKELLELLLNRNFNMDDEIVVERFSSGKMTKVKDVGITTINGKESQLIIVI